MGHTAWAPEGREGRSQAGPKGRKLEVGAWRAPRLLVVYILSMEQNEMWPSPYWLVGAIWGDFCLNSQQIV